jgi:hypothetical protein
VNVKNAWLSGMSPVAADCASLGPSALTCGDWGAVLAPLLLLLRWLAEAPPPPQPARATLTIAMGQARGAILLTIIHTSSLDGYVRE